jgi:hypothetical protein
MLRRRKASWERCHPAVSRRQPFGLLCSNPVLDALTAEAALAAVCLRECARSGLIHCPGCDLPISPADLLGPAAAGSLLLGAVPGHPFCGVVPEPLAPDYWKRENAKEVKRCKAAAEDSYFEWVESRTDKDCLSYCPVCDRPFDPLTPHAMACFLNGGVPGHPCRLEEQ